MDIRAMIATAPRNTHHTVIIRFLFLQRSTRFCRTERFGPCSAGLSTLTVSLHLHAQSQKQGRRAMEQTTAVQK